MPSKQDYEWLKERILEVMKEAKERTGSEQVSYGWIAARIYQLYRSRALETFNIAIEDDDEKYRDYRQTAKFAKIVQRQANNLVKDGKLIKGKIPFYSGARYNFRPRPTRYWLPGE